MRTLTLTSCAAMLALSISARAEPPRERVSDLRLLLVQAIDSPDGRAFGILPMDHPLAREAQARAPLHLDVTTLARYAQSGCRRLNLSISAASSQAASPDAASRRFDIGMDVCRNGNPPRSLVREDAR